MAIHPSHDPRLQQRRLNVAPYQISPIPHPRRAALVVGATAAILGAATATLGAWPALHPGSAAAAAQETDLPRPEATEVWTPVPPVVRPGPATAGFGPPSDAIVLFDGTGLGAWVNVRDGRPAGWTVADGVMTVDKSVGDIRTRRSFGSYQLHLEWRVPPEITGSGQARGNSGLYLAFSARDEIGYEVQILDPWRNETYVNGMAGSVYKQAIPLANPGRPPGEWQTYDVIWHAPTFADDGALLTPGRVTVLFNGVLVQDAFALRGSTVYRGEPSYRPHGDLPIMLQSHGDPSEPISFRNIWVRPLGTSPAASPPGAQSAASSGASPPGARAPGDTMVVAVPGTDVALALAWIPGPEPLWMTVTEVTDDQFGPFRHRRLDAGGEAGSYDADAVTRPSPPYEDPVHGMGKGDHPAGGMTRLAALRYARWLSERTGRLFRLPTEAEWEHACRAGAAEPGAAGLEDVAWYEANSRGAFHPVGRKRPNAWGLHDMRGNVAEWVLGGDPRGRGVVRGGAFDDPAESLGCDARVEEPAAWKRRDPQVPKSRWWNTDSPHVGFRLVSPAGEPDPAAARAYWAELLGG